MGVGACCWLSTEIIFYFQGAVRGAAGRTPRRPGNDNYGDNFSSTHSILLSDPGNESYGSGGSNAPLKSKIGGLVAELLYKTFRSMLRKLGSCWRFYSFYIGPLITPPGPGALKDPSANAV